MNKAQKLELARLIHATEHLLHRYCVSQFYAETSTSSPCAQALTFHQVGMLMAIHERDCMTIKQLTQELHVKAPAVSAMVDRLVEMGLLTRTENPDDRREVLVRLSPVHSKQMEEMEQRKLQAFVRLVEKVGDEHANAWGKLGIRIQEVLTKELQNPNNDQI